MSLAGTSADRPTPPAVRPNVLALPSPTTSRFLLLVVALLTAGAIVGNWMHNEIAGSAWVADVVRCEREASAAVTQLPADPAAIERNAMAQRCRATSEWVRSAYVFGGIAVAGLAGLAVLIAFPHVIERRRRFRTLDPTHPQARRVGELLDEVGISAGVTTVVGRLGMRDAFSYGRPGRYTIALPMGLLVRPPALFDPVARHEVAHIVHRDVIYATLARAMWYALLPLLAVPVVVGSLTGSVGLLPDYIWRAAVLLLVTQLISRALLRSREHDADLRAAEPAGGLEAMTGVLKLVPQHGTKRLWQRGLLALHPTPAERTEALWSPSKVSGLTGLDGFTAGFLAAVIVPTLNTALSIPLSTVERADMAWLVAALVAGPWLGGSVGVGAWRAATVLRSVGQRPRIAPAAIGVAGGLVVGQIVALEQLATGLSGGFDHPSVLLVSALLGLGTTAVVAGIGEVVAEAAPAWGSRRRIWLAVLAVDSLLFATALWAAQALQNALDFGGWVIAGSVLVTIVASPLTLLTAAVTAALVAWSLWRTRAGAQTPRWLVAVHGGSWPSTGSPTLWGVATIGAVVGLAGGLVLVGNRIVAGAAVSDAELINRFYTTQWLIAATAPAATLVLVVLGRRRGAGVAMLAGQLAVLAATLSFLVLNTALGGDLDPGFILQVVSVPIALGLLLSLLVAAIGAVPTVGDDVVPRPATARVLAVTAGLTVSVAVLLVQRPLTGSLLDPTQLLDAEPVQQQGEVVQVPKPAPEESELLAQLGVDAYVERTAPDLVQRAAAIDQLLAEIDQDVVTGPQRAARIRRDLLPPTQALLDDALAFEPPNEAIGSVHAQVIAALRATVDATSHR